MRALVAKIPGFYFSNYFQGSQEQNALISVPQYKDILDEVWEQKPARKAVYDLLTEKYDLVDGIPKDQLMVGLNPDISLQQRLFVANSLRNFFTDQETILFDRMTIVDSFTNIQLIFKILVYIIAAIALTITFFLLLVSTR